MRTKRVSTDSTENIGEEIRAAGAELPPEGEVRLSIFDQWANFRGVVIVCRPDFEPVCSVKGSVTFPGSERMVEFDVEFHASTGAEPSGPMFAPDTSSETKSPAEFYSAGCSWTRQTAPPVKMHKVSQGGRELAERAARALAEWKQSAQV